MTNPFGHFQFDNILVGATYAVAIKHKTYAFTNPNQIITVHDAITDLDFIADNPITSNALGEISGKVINNKGVGIPNIRLELVGGEIEDPIYVITGKDGSYTFENVKVGNTYILSVQDKRLIFREMTRSIHLTDSIKELNFRSLNFLLL